jgi:hypothetical protein
MQSTEKQTEQTPQRPVAQPAANGSEAYASCEECGAPLDEKQRYCVSCGARRRDKGTPAVQYFATAGRRTRGAGRVAGASGARAAAVLFFVLLPLAVAVGVLVGKGNGGNNDQQLADAIKNLQANGVAAGTATPAGAATPITSDFTLDKGYTVELRALPQSSDQAAVDAAKKDATSKGAADVGIINTSEFSVTPAPAAGSYVLYSGQFKAKGEAEAALKKLGAKFPDAKVVAVKRSSGASSDQGQLVAKTAQGRGLHAQRPEGRLGHGPGPAGEQEDRQGLRRLPEEPAGRDRRRRQWRRLRQPGRPGER